MNIFDMSISSVLDVLSYGLVLVYGLVLAAAIAGSFETARQRRIVLWLCPVFLLVQLLGWLLLGEDSVTRIYPLIVHLPLVLILVFALKRPWGVSIVSWGRVAAEMLTHSAFAAIIIYILLLGASFYLLQRYFVAAAYSTMTYSRSALLLFGSLPCTYYIFDYATTVYSDVLYSGAVAINEFLPTVLIVFYILFLPAFHVQTQSRSHAEMERSLLEVELEQAQQEMDTIREAETQAAVYQHDMRHHLNMIGGLLTSGQTQQAQDYIRRVQSDVEAITPRRFCENETVNLLCASFAQKAQRAHVELCVDARVPSELSISDTELCSLLSNALENALRVTAELEPASRRIVKLYCGIRLNKLLIEVRNPCDAPPEMRNGIPVSNRVGHGYGCRSIQAIAQRRGGLCQFRTEGGTFLLQVMLPVHTEE